MQCGPLRLSSLCFGTLRVVSVFGFVTFPLVSQDIRITADALSQQTTRAVFGKLPKGILAVQVGVCNQTAAQITVPLTRLYQQVAVPAGMTVLTYDIADTLIGTTNARGAWGQVLRWGTITVQLGALAAALATGHPDLQAGLEAGAIAGSGTLSILAANNPANAHLQLSHARLPDPMTLGPLGCGPPSIVLVEDTTQAKIKAHRVDFSMPVGRQ